MTDKQPGREGCLVGRVASALFALVVTAFA
jgi:hypothetical protein